MPETIEFARCPEHGLHGQRARCFECGAECEQVRMVPLAEVERVVQERDQLRAACCVLLDAKDRAILGHDDDRWTAVRDALGEAGE